MQLSGVQLIAALSPWAVLPVNLIYDASIKLPHSRQAIEAIKEEWIVLEKEF